MTHVVAQGLPHLEGVSETSTRHFPTPPKIKMEVPFRGLKDAPSKHPVYMRGALQFGRCFVGVFNLFVPLHS